jgi:transcriptional regulator with XRE-family HTH domain
MAAELGSFLRSRRARVQPVDLGLTPRGPRRVPGLRRDEVASVAGVSTDYYTRVEQGRVTPSRQVLDAVADALRLDEIEREHMRRLADLRPRRRRTPRRRHSAEVVRPGVRDILDRLVELPAVVLGQSLDVLAWTPIGAALLDLRAEGERNMARRVFLLSETRTLYPDWGAVAAETVSHLRRLSAERETDGELTKLIGELAVASPDFARLWSRHDVTAGVSRRKAFNHPQAGSFELEPEVMTLAGDQQTLCVYRAEPGSAGADALALLNTLVVSGLAVTDVRTSSASVPAAR